MATRLSAIVAALFLCLAAFAMALSSEQLLITPGSDALHLSAPRFHFLTGQSLSHLHDGISVPLRLMAGSRPAVTNRLQSMRTGIQIAMAPPSTWISDPVI